MPPPPEGAVLRILRQALKSDIQLVRWRDDGTPEAVETTLISVDRTGVVVVRPDAGHRVRPGEPLEIVLQGGGGRFRGRVRCLGHGERPSGGNRPILTLRLSLPSRLEGGERRRSHRVSVGFDLAPTGRLRDPESGKEWLADILNISVEGLQLRSRDGNPGILPGDVLWIDADLPQPVGLLDRPIRVMNVRRDGRSDRYLLGVVLMESVPELSEFVRGAEIRRATRLRSA
ncbi:MAG: PilZ domain-containing protein [Phycisphaerales bacterium]|nr:PilZ domain-containing protein [Phycisphaerales bacterium]